MDDEISARARSSSNPGVGNEPVVERLEEQLPAWLRPARGENRLPIALAIVLAAALQLLLPRRFTLIPYHWLLPVLMGRSLSLALLALISLDNGTSAVLLNSKLIRGIAGDQAAPLLGSAAAVYLTNVIAFGILFWEFDRGGPFRPGRGAEPLPRLLVPADDPTPSRP